MKTIQEQCSTVQLYSQWLRHFSVKQAYAALTVQSTADLLISEFYTQFSSPHMLFK